MSHYLAKRTARVLFTVYLVATFTFGMIRLLPGGPLTTLRVKLARQGMDPDQINAYIENYQNIRPDATLLEQYQSYMLSVAGGDLGRSISLDEPVTNILAEAVPWTVFVVVVSTVLMFAFAVLFGAMMAYWEGSRFDQALTGVSILSASVPFYVLALLLVYFLGYQYQVLPTGGTTGLAVEKELSVPFVMSALEHAILPVASFTITGMGVQALAMRGNSIQVLGEDYVRVARLRGLADRRIATRYVGRNAILPMYTGFLLLLGFNLGGTIILERIFSYPGLGFYMFKALKARDYPLMMGTFLVITVALVVGAYVADLTYSKVDPRISSGGSNEAY
ncbi:ABC transporter permease [Halorubellus salinus]|uniref:ABC transporter permease n=1 Tax=Halorubellus salinus TaxID=755309 RepID=UPI001D0873A7|nr:ABC transporter permease [Halorubellus salinus]